MNKKLIAVAIAAAVAAPAAMANDTTLYGKVHLSVSSNEDNYTVNNHASRLGVKGSEDLGNGLKAIFQYEMTYAGVDSADAFGSTRNSYIGLAGGFGQVRVGRHDTPYKVALNSTGLDFLADSIIDPYGAYAGFHEVRTNNAIAYISPNFSGFTVAAAIVPGEESGTTETVVSVATPGAAGFKTVTDAGDDDGLADSYSLGLMYSGGGLKAALGYEDLADGANPAGTSNRDNDKWMASVAYTMGDFTVGGVYEDHDNLGSDTDTWGLMGKANFGNNALIVNYVDFDNDTTGAEQQDFGVALQHTFSKRSSVYVAYNNKDMGAAGDDDTFALGMIHSF